MKFLKKTWYMAAWQEELSAGSGLARTIAGYPMLMFLDANGDAAVLEDMCPHRFAPLSRGRIAEGRVTCGYHGLVFDSSGHCVYSPHGALPSQARVRRFPSVTRHTALWIWLGEPVEADESKIPDLAFLTRAPHLAKRAGYMHARASQELCVDNILDLSHADCLHPLSLGGGATTRARAKVAESTDAISLHWDMKNEVPLPFLALEYPGIDKLDMWLDVVWRAPGVMYLEAGGGPPGSTRETAVNTFNVHIMMPERETTTHYFYCNVRNYRTDDASYHAFFSNALRTAFEEEDKPMLEAQQARIGERHFESMKPLLLQSDRGTSAVRRRMAALLAEQDGDST
jgi:phenylpropionate dioxygenase-like ring-hydroxylating dioxygenase large terminal subunit